MEDNFLIDENAEGVDEETVKAIVAGKKKELDAMEAFRNLLCVRRIAEGCERYPNDMGKHSKRRQVEMQVRIQSVQDMTIQRWKDSTPQAAHQQQADWWTCMQSNTDTPC